MSQQINLYNARFLRQREWLTANTLAAAFGLAVLMVAGWSVWAQRQAADAQADVDSSATQLKAAQQRMAELGARLATNKPSPQLANELATAQALVKARGDVLAAVQGGILGDDAAGAFSEYLRGFARQTPAGVWLTGVRIGAGGGDMEIRGRMLNSSLLPEYIRRLSGEKAFQGKTFSALDVRQGMADAKPAQAGQPAVVAAAAGFVEFVLAPRSGPAAEARK